MREPEAIELLGRKVAAEGFLTIPQVANGVGAHRRRTIDALMVQTWPSRTLQIIAVEYKQFRSDWRRELKDGAKAETIAQHCDRFLILAPKGIVHIGEVPEGWGLWEFDSRRRLLRTKPAPHLHDPILGVDLEPRPLTLSFLVAVLRAAEKVNRHDSVLGADRARLRAHHDKRVEDAVGRRSLRYESLKETVDQFERNSGITISNSWEMGEIGDGLQKYLKHPDYLIDELKRQKQALERMLGMVDDAINGL